MTTEARIHADIDDLRARFPDTPTLYRETCALLFFRYGITPTANKLYQYVRKGSMSAPTDALSKFWDELRDKSRIRVERADLPEELKTAAGELVAKLWTEAQAASESGFAEARREMEAAAVNANETAEAARQELRIQQEECLRLQAKLSDSEGVRQSQQNELSADKVRIESLRQQLDVYSKKIQEAEAAHVEARRDFAIELEKSRLIQKTAEERYLASERRALLEIDRERTTCLRLQKELQASRDQLQGIHEQSASEIARLQSDLGEMKQKLGISEGALQEMRAGNVRLEQQLQLARASMETARTQEAMVAGELATVRAELMQLRPGRRKTRTKAQ